MSRSMGGAPSPRFGSRTPGTDPCKSATMVFPSSGEEASTQLLDIEVAAGGLLRWSGLPLLVVSGGRHQQTTRVSLDEDATLDMVDEIAVGRMAELPRSLDTRLRVVRGGRPLIDQRQVYDPTSPAWTTTAGVGMFRHVRHHLLVGCQPTEPAAEVDSGLATARIPQADDVELTITLGVDRCAAADWVGDLINGPDRSRNHRHDGPRTNHHR